MNNCVICQKKLIPIKNDFVGRNKHTKCWIKDKKNNNLFSCPLCGGFHSYDGMAMVRHLKNVHDIN